MPLETSRPVSGQVKMIALMFASMTGGRVPLLDDPVPPCEPDRSSCRRAFSSAVTAGETTLLDIT